MSEKQALVPRLRFPEFREAGEWQESLLDDICDMQSGKFIAASEISANFEEGLFPCFGGNGLRGYTKMCNQSGRYSLIGRQGALCGNVKLVDGNFYATEHAVVITPKQGISTNWLFYNLTLLDLNRFATGQAQPGLSVEALEKVPCAIPRDEDEQQKIADCLSSLDTLIVAQAEKIDALKTYKKGLMQQLFPRDNAIIPRLRFPEFQNAGEWAATTLGEVAKITSGGTPSRSESAYWGGSIPWITTSLINFNRIENSNEFITMEGLNNSSAKLFPEQTLLMAMYGQGKTRGKVAIMGIKAATNQACAAMQFDDEVDTNFAFQNLASRYDEIRKLSNEGGQENLSAGLIKNILFVHPYLDEQQKIANCLSSLDALIAEFGKKLEILKAHKETLMQQLFPSVEVGNV